MEILLSQPENKLKEKIISIVLCAGEGTRAKDIAVNIPKPLIKVKSLNNRSILSLILSNLKKLNLDPIVVITGHLGNLIANIINPLQRIDQNGKEHIFIQNSGARYKLGPLYSFLSVTTNSQVFKEDKIYLVFPGDTVFDYELLQEILVSLSENYSQGGYNSIIFYRKIKAEILKNKLKKNNFNLDKTISCLKIEEKDSKAIVKKITQKKLSSILSEEEINQVIPIFIFSTAYVKIIKALASPVKFRYIREVVNLMIGKKMQFLAIPVNPEYDFYDIDTPLDLKILNEKKKKSGQ